MKLDAHTFHAVGAHLDRHDVAVEDRTILCVIEGIHYRLDEDGCWRFVENQYDAGWAQCVPPAALQGLF